VIQDRLTGRDESTARGAFYEDDIADGPLTEAVNSLIGQASRTPNMALLSAALRACSRQVIDGRVHIQCLIA
jgi:hypothetical protein